MSGLSAGGTVAIRPKEAIMIEVKSIDKPDERRASFIRCPA
jgi:hypothetical protein